MKSIILFLIAFLCISTLMESASVPPNATQDLKWRLLGPLRAGWSMVAEGIPDEPNTYYFGAADGGVWKTTDAGLTWQPIADHAPFSSVQAIAISKNNPRTIYVGTGQVATRYDVMDGTGIYKTTDDGKTWISLGLADSRHIGRILLDPRNDHVLIVAVLGHLFGPNQERGIFRSEDGGTHWQKVLFVDENTGAVDLASDPATPDVIYASTWQVRQYPFQSYFIPQSGPGSGIWKSTDGGKTWAQTSKQGLPQGALSRIGLAVGAQSQGRRIYAAIDAEKDAGLYRSDDGGASWQYINKDPELASTYFGHLTADPKSADVVYAMGRSVHESRDGGKTFTIMKGSPGGDDYHFMWINPKFPQYRILAADQGTAVSVNDGSTWTPWYNQATGQFYRLGADNRFPYWVYSGQQDSGTVGVATRSDYGQLTFRDWHPVGGDERDYDLPDPEDPLIVYGSGLGGRLSRWDQRTGRVENVSPWPVSSYAARPTTVKYRYTWITPIAISQRAPYALYQGAQVLFQSLDKGHSWKIISPDLSGADPNAKNCDGDVPLERTTACGYGVIFIIAPSTNTDGLIWIGTDNGRIQVTRDDGKNWSNVTPPEIKDWSKIAGIDPSPKDPATAYVAVDRHRLDDRHPYIYRTHDFGKTWTMIASGIPDDSWVNTVREDPMLDHLLYAGTRTGVFVSFDDGDHWQSLQTNLPRTGVNDLLVHGNDLIAATQGRSIWILDDVSPLRQLDASSLSAGPILMKPATAIRIAKNENKDTPLPPEFPTTPNPPTGALIDYFLAKDAGVVSLEILNDKGEVVRSFKSDEKPERPNAERYFAERWLLPLPMLSASAGHHRFLWDLRYPRPSVESYEYSIAAVPGVDTAALPQGIMVPPGHYTVRLHADGKDLTQSLEVQQDPRSSRKQSDIEAQLSFYNEVAAAVAQALPKAKQLEETEKKLTDAKGPEADQQRKQITKFKAAMSALSSLLTDLEGADGPPTQPQRDLFAESKKDL
jgi:photosystem II stability/assembly factor-like uncharacterized protein